MVTSHIIGVTLLMYRVVLCGATDLVLNVSDEELENHLMAGVPQLPSLDPAELSDLCDDTGYAVYDNGVYVSGTASCDEEGSYCCMTDAPETQSSMMYSDVEDGSSSNSTNNSTDFFFNSPCDGFTGVVCHGTEENANCKGEDACKNSTIGLVKAGSCQGLEACKDTIIESVSVDSCVGEKACAEANIGIVAESSCRGSTACFQSIIGNVTDNSCVADREACNGGTIEYVSQESCQQYRSCSYSYLGTILSGSCRGHYACGAQALEETKTVLDYVHQSCVGPHTCHRATIKEATGGSCLGDFSCGSFYGGSVKIDSISNRSCIGNFVCMDATLTLIKDQSCIGRDSCRQIKSRSVTDQSCFGDRSCQGASMMAARRSCIGNFTCEELIVNGSLVNSCQLPWLCGFQEHDGDLKDLCQGSLGSVFGPPCSRGASSMPYGSAIVMMTMGMLVMQLVFG